MRVGGGRWWITFQTRSSQAWAVWNFDDLGSHYINVGRWWLSYRSPRANPAFWRSPLAQCWRFRIERRELVKRIADPAFWWRDR